MTSEENGVTRGISSHGGGIGRVTLALGCSNRLTVGRGRPRVLGSPARAAGGRVQPLLDAVLGSRALIDVAPERRRVVIGDDTLRVRLVAFA